MTQKLDDQRVLEIEALIADIPTGLGSWSLWTDQMKERVPELIAEIRRLRNELSYLMACQL